MSDERYTYIWEYDVHPDRQAEFLAHYAPEGSWVELFRRSTEYLGTELYRDRARPDRFITIDHWRTEQAFREFRRRFAEDFDALDRRCAAFTRHEASLGEFQKVPHATSNRSAPAATVVPVLVYDDVAKAVDWLCGAFGFSERLRAPGRDGRISHAQLAIAEGAVMIGQRGGPFTPPRQGEVTQYVIVHVDDVDRHFERSKKFGARIVSPPTDMPFGERQYTAEDAEGHRWTFSQHIADVAPEAWGAITPSLY